MVPSVSLREILAGTGLLWITLGNLTVFLTSLFDSLPLSLSFHVPVLLWVIPHEPLFSGFSGVSLSLCAPHSSFLLFLLLLPQPPSSCLSKSLVFLYYSFYLLSLLFCLCLSLSLYGSPSVLLCLYLVSQSLFDSITNLTLCLHIILSFSRCLGHSLSSVSDTTTPTLCGRSLSDQVPCICSISPPSPVPELSVSI